MKKIAMIGTGYVGLVSGAGISDFGHSVVCADILEEKIELLNSGEIPIFEPGLKELVKKNVDAGRLSFTSNIGDAIQSAEVVFIAVGTPEGKNNQADLSSVESVSKSIGKNINGYKVICTKSTVPVGTCELIIRIINKYKDNNIEFDYVSNPEFLREGSAVKDFLWPNRVVIGANNDKSFNIMKEVYRPIYINERPILQTSVITAEMIKYAANSFLALKISYINEVANLCDSLGADIHHVAKAMGKDGRISPKFLHPGPGFGGSCFPKDIKAFTALSNKHGLHLRTIEAAIQTNKKQKQIMVDKMKKLIGGSFYGKKIAILGLAFKPNTDDIRDSAAIPMIDSINKDGGQIRAYDPIANDSMKRNFPDLEYFTSWEEACKGADGVSIMTEWNEFRGISLVSLKALLKSPILLDTRNIFSIKNLKENNFSYENVGRSSI